MPLLAGFARSLDSGGGFGHLSKGSHPEGQVKGGDLLWSLCLSSVPPSPRPQGPFFLPCARIFWDSVPYASFASLNSSNTRDGNDRFVSIEVDVDDDAPQRRDMNIYDEAYNAMSTSQNVQLVIDCARRYFGGEHTEAPVWEVLSVKNAKAVTDISGYLRNENAR